MGDTLAVAEEQGGPVATSESRPSNTARSWAIAGLVLACIWAVFSVLPIPATTIIGLPFLLLALIAVAIALYLRWERRSPGVRRWAGLALGVSAFGCAWQIVMAVFWGTLLIGGGVSLWQYAQQLLQLTPTP